MKYLKHKKLNIMRKFYTLLTAILLTTTLFAQSPEKMSYQAVVRDASDNLITNTQIGMQISILQGSISGTAVYVETQEPSTNINGLVSIEIGTGTTSDDFSTIDWANGPYFIKTETDPDGATGGIDYTITGTSQLLSVPYALHAKTAETVTGGITETDPTFTSSQAANITATDITNLSNLSGINTGDQDISGITTNATAITSIQGEQTTQDAAIAINTAKDTAGIYHANREALDLVSGTNTGDQDLSVLANKTNVLELNNTTAFTPDADYEPATKKYVDDQQPVHYVGELIGANGEDGVVFWVDHTGEHGLICSKTDIDGGSGVAWSNITSEEIGATAKSDFNGLTNTTAIIAQSGHTSSAASLCQSYSTTGTSAGDWYLPSIDELKKIYNAKYEINKALNTNSFVLEYYWSSTERNNSFAWNSFFNFGTSYYEYKNNTYRVRAVRAF